MKALKRTLFPAIATVVLAGGALTAWFAQQGTDLPNLPAAPSGVWNVLYAQPYTLDAAYTHWYREERPEFSAGYILVLDADPVHVYPRQELNKVLYVGHQTAERINPGVDGNGRIVVLVPTERDANGMPVLDLGSTLMWFGKPALPEQVDADIVAAEHEWAVAEKIRPIRPAEVGDLVAYPSRDELDRYLAQVVMQYVPEESGFAESLLAPRVK